MEEQEIKKEPELKQTASFWNCPLTPKCWLCVLIGLILLIAAFLVGFTLGKSQTLTTIPVSRVEVTPIPTLIITPTPTPDPTAGWEIYRNEKYKYEIKYPSGIYLDKLYSGFQNSDPYASLPVTSSDSVCLSTEGPGVDTCISVKNKILERQIDELKRSLPYEQKISTKIINGIEWTRFVGNDKVGYGPFIYYLVQRDNFLYEISVHSSLENVLELMMSIFKFLD